MAGREARAGRFPGPSLIPALHEIQREHGWLPSDALVELSRETRRPLYEIQGLISFYPHFRASGPPATVKVGVCRDLACWLRSDFTPAESIARRFEDAEDVSVCSVSCLGRCDVAPAAVVNEQPVAVHELDATVAGARAGKAQTATALRPERTWPTDPYAAASEAPYALARSVLAGDLEAERIIAELKASNLRGMGGAGFPTGMKWGLVRAEAPRPKYVICNADESEPGTFKDRQILAELPHLVLEGMLLGMLAVGAEQGWVFIRHEYGPEEAVIRAELARLTEAGLLGTDVLGTGKMLSIDVFVSPGGYILGEETALIECMEGHRGEPRNKPPFPGTHGLWDKPTLMNSVETFAAVPPILTHGSEWWRAQGHGDADGLKFFAVSGHVGAPGVYCVPLGTPLGELIELAGGLSGDAGLGAVQPGGASSNFLGPDSLEVPLDFGALAEAGSMLGSGAVVVMDARTDLLAAATNVLGFFRKESCGKCVPCRVGSTKAEAILSELLTAGGGVADVDARIAELEETMRLTSICGLGQVALGPVMSVIERGRPDSTS
ncbi:MAG: NAD(P)H-dependent oxidoreductase subunit E [Gaiellaceae bacterium]